MDVAPQDCRLARSFLEALDVASRGHVTLALMSFGRLEGLFEEDILDWLFGEMVRFVE
jgi:hypothetical protein